jgi:hypothetical protein
VLDSVSGLLADGRPGWARHRCGHRAGSPQAGAQNGAYAGFAAAGRSQAGPQPTELIGPQPLYGFEGNNLSVHFAGNGDGGNDVITIPDPGVFGFSNTRAFTLEAWVNGGPGQETGGALIARGAGGAEQFVIDVVDGNYRFFTRDGTAPNNPTTVMTALGPNGTWQHVVAVLDQPAGRMKLYVNGVEGLQIPPPLCSGPPTHQHCARRTRHRRITT